MKRLAFIFILFVILNTLAGCRAAPPPTPIALQLNWIPSAQDAGFYAAAQNGDYTSEKLSVTFLPGGPSVDRIQPILDGTVQFGVAGGDELLLARSQGKPVRGIATIYRHSPIVFITLADSGIERPTDFMGKEIRVTANLIPSLHAMTARFGITPDQYSEVVLPSEVEGFASGQPPIWAVYIFGLALEAQRAGYQINLIYPDDYGVHFYADTLFTTDAMIAEHPEIVEGFLRASLQGWQWAVENPEKVGPLVLAKGPETNVEMENARMSASLPLINTGEDRLGWMKPEIWSGMAETLRAQGILTQSLDVSQVYTMDFLNKIAANGSSK